MTTQSKMFGATMNQQASRILLVKHSQTYSCNHNVAIAAKAGNIHC